MANGFRITRRVQFADTDMAGVLHFANYCRYMEEVEHAFWRSLGLSVLCRAGEDDISWPRVAVHCEYLAPAHFEDELELVLTIGKIGAKSIAFEVGFFRDEQPLARGSITAACCRMKAGRFRAVPIPDSLRSALTAASNLQEKG